MIDGRVDIEKKVLGCALIDEEFPEKVQSSGLTVEYFTDLRNKAVFKAIKELLKNNTSISPVTTLNAVERLNLSDLVKPSDIVEIINSVSSSVHLEPYCEILKDIYQRNTVFKLSDLLKEYAFEKKNNISDILSLIDKEIDKLQGDYKKKGFVELDKILVEQYEELQKRCSSSDKIVGLRCGIPKLDKLYSGFQRGNSYCIAARPSMGKSAMALRLATGFAKNNYKVAVFSLEMSETEIINRLLASNSKLDHYKIQNGEINDNDWVNIGDAINTLSVCKISLYTEALTISELPRTLRRLKRVQGLDAVILDQFSLVHGLSGMDRRETIGKVSKLTKQLAKELNIAFISLSQLNREVLKNDKCIPNLSNLAECGDIEQDMNGITFLHRPAYYNLKDDNGKEYNKGELWLITAKNRGGSLGNIKCLMKMETQEIEQMEDYGEY